MHRSFTFFSILSLSVSLPTWAAPVVGQVAAAVNVMTTIQREGDDPVYLLADGVTSRIFSIAQGQVKERYQLQIAVDLGKGVEEKVWIHYIPGLPKRIQCIELLDANGQSTTDLSSATSMMTLRPGVSAWTVMEHVETWSANRATLKLAPSDSRRIASAEDPTQEDPQEVRIDTSPIHSLQLPTGFGRVWGRDCEYFIEEGGKFGPYGKYLMSEMTDSLADKLFDGKFGDSTRICPKYKNFNSKERKNFWVWFAMSLAMGESTCNPESRHTGRTPHQVAAGLLGLDLGHTHIYSGGVCGSINVYNADASLNCGFKMLNFDIDAHQNEERAVFWDEGYWDTLRPSRPPGQKTENLIKLYSPCR